MGVDRLFPVIAQTSGAVTQIACGANHACALLASGAVECWGAGTLGQIGNGGAKNQPSPLAVPNLAQVLRARC